MRNWVLLSNGFMEKLMMNSLASGFWSTLFQDKRGAFFLQPWLQWVQQIHTID